MQNIWQKLDKPIIALAPMDGITDYPMRRIQAQIGKADLMYTEFVSAEGLSRFPDKFTNHLKFDTNQQPIIAQLVGKDPDSFRIATQEIARLGFAGVDINMGCPSSRVVAHGSGGSLIGNYQLADQIISAVFQGLKDVQSTIPVSVKTRIGKTSDVSNDWINFLTTYPLSEISLHGRLLKQGLSGEVNWAAISSAAGICRDKKIVILGNGGVKSRKEAIDLCRKYVIDGILIGQAAIGNPWVFCECKPAEPEILKTLVAHAQYGYEFYGEKRFKNLYKHFCCYVKSFDNATDLRVELLKTNNPAEIDEKIKLYLKRKSC